MQADVTLNISDEQFNLLLQNETFIKEFAEEFAGVVFQRYMFQESFINAMKSEFTKQYIEKNLDEIKKSLDKKVNLIIGQNLGKHIRESIKKNLEE